MCQNYELISQRVILLANFAATNNVPYTFFANYEVHKYMSAKLLNIMFRCATEGTTTPLCLLAKSGDIEAIPLRFIVFIMEFGISVSVLI